MMSIQHHVIKGEGKVGGRVGGDFVQCFVFLSLSLMSLREAGYYVGEAANSRQVIGSIVALNLILHHYVT